MEFSYHEHTPKLYSKRGTFKTVETKNAGQGTPGYVDKNEKLLLEVQVTENLRENVSCERWRMRDDNVNEKTHAKVTIVKPSPGKAAAGSPDNNCDRPMKDNFVEKRPEAWVAEKRNVVNCRRLLRPNAVPFDDHSFNQQRSNLSKGQTKKPEGTTADGPCSNVRNYRSVQTDNDSQDQALPAILIELGALHKILDLLKPEDLESTNAWYSSESCCREIVERFQNLLREWASDRKKLDRCLAKDGVLVKCENCGVIKCSEVQRPGKVVESNYCARMTAELGSKPKFVDTGTNTRRWNKVETRRPETANLGNIEPSIISREVLSRDRKNPEKKESESVGFFRNTSTDIDFTPNFAETRLMTDEKCVQASHRKFSDANGAAKNLALMKTLEYLARGNFNVTEDSKSSMKDCVENPVLLEHPFFRDPKMERKHNFDIHGSRDMDEPELDFIHDDVTIAHRKRKDGTVILEGLNGSRQSLDPSRQSDAELQFCASDTSSLHSWSAENSIGRWIKDGCHSRAEDDPKNKNHNGNEDFNCEFQSEPSSNTVQNIRARIAETIKKFADRNPSGSNEEASKIDKNDTGLIKSRFLKDEKELRGISKRVSNTIWDEEIQDCTAIDISDKTEVLSKTNERASMSGLSVVSSSRFDRQDCWIENAESFERQILYDQILSPDSSASASAFKVPSIYRKILESNEEMDWESFERLVTALHPSQRELWCDICRAVSNEAKRVADETGATTEVCIEINPRTCDKKNVGTIRSCGDEIIFELDMNLQDVRTIINTTDAVSMTNETN